MQAREKTNIENAFADAEDELVNSAVNTKNLKELLEINSDFVFRELLLGEERNIPVTLMFFDGLINSKQADDDILMPLFQSVWKDRKKDVKGLINEMESGMLYHTVQKTRVNLSDCVKDILDGSVALVFDQWRKLLRWR